MENLMQEIIDIIIGNLQDNPSALQACSLVCKSWAPASRSHLFAFTSLVSLDAICKWTLAFSRPTTNHLPFFTPSSQLVTTLRLSIENEEETSAKILTPFIDHIWSFNRVEKLILGRWHLSEVYQFPRLHFGHLASSLRALILVCTESIGHAALIRFICMFPNLDDLTIRVLQCYHSPSVLQNVTSPSFRGRLEVSELLQGKVDFLRCLAALPARFSSMSLQRISGRESKEYVSLMTSSASTLKTLEVSALQEDPPVMILLPDCPILETLIIHLEQSSDSARSIDWIADFLAGVTSSCLSHVVFTSFNLQTKTGDVEHWKNIENRLLALCENSIDGLKISFRVIHYHHPQSEVFHIIRSRLPAISARSFFRIELVEDTSYKYCAYCGTFSEAAACDCGHPPNDKFGKRAVEDDEHSDDGEAYSEDDSDSESEDG